MEKTVPPFQPSQCSDGHGETTHIGDLRDTSEPSSCRAESETDDVDMNAASDGGQVPFPPAPMSMGEETQTNAAADTPTNADDDTPTSVEVDSAAASSDERNTSANDDAQRATSQHDISPTPTVDEVDVEDIRMESAVYLDETLHINELEHYVTQEGVVDSESEGATSDNGEVPIPAALAATFEQEMTPDTKHHDNQVHSAPQVRTRDVNSLHTAQEARRAADLHARTMMQSRARKSPINASPAVATAATAESTTRRRENSRVIKQWTKAHPSSVPDIALVDEQGNGVDKAIGKWIADCAQELAELVKILPHPVEFLKAMKLRLLVNFGHAICSETQLAVIRQYATNKKLSLKTRELCSKWGMEAAAKRGKTRWTLTASIQRWNRVIKYDEELPSATVAQQVNIDEWGVLNAVCLLLPNLTPTDTATGVVMPQTKSSLYHNSAAVREAINHVLRKSADWQPILDLIRSERLAPQRRY